MGDLGLNCIVLEQEGQEEQGQSWPEPLSSLPSWVGAERVMREQRPREKTVASEPAFFCVPRVVGTLVGASSLASVSPLLDLSSVSAAERIVTLSFHVLGPGHYFSCWALLLHRNRAPGLVPCPGWEGG